MPQTNQRTRGNVGKSWDELESKHLFTKAEKLHLNAVKANAITLDSAIVCCPRLKNIITKKYIYPFLFLPPVF